MMVAEVVKTVLMRNIPSMGMGEVAFLVIKIRTGPPAEATTGILLDRRYARDTTQMAK